jgi:hypothetical protein
VVLGREDWTQCVAGEGEEVARRGEFGHPVQIEPASSLSYTPPSILKPSGSLGKLLWQSPLLRDSSETPLPPF